MSSVLPAEDFGGEIFFSFFVAFILGALAGTSSVLTELELGVDVDKRADLRAAIVSKVGRFLGEWWYMAKANGDFVPQHTARP
jgi:hypothetical protein